MRILFLSNYFPPEVNAPATRVYEHARQWVRDGHDVEVLTSNPNFPEGRIYDGYQNRFATEAVEGIKVTRVPMYVSANQGILLRTLSFITYMIATRWYARRLQMKPDVVVATSPQFFAAVAGYLMSRYQRVPFVLEIRDLWPESIVAVGAVPRNAIIRFFERIERFLYEQSDHIVVVTKAFKRFITDKGIDPAKITVLKNGADLESWKKALDAGKLAALRKQHGLDGAFVASYIGTIGMAHRVDVILEAAAQCPDPDIVFMIVGTGSERAGLEARLAEAPLPNVRLLDKVSKEEVRYLLALTDVSIVHLKASPLFKTVIPSKIFEAMATRTPIVLGVEGETKEIIEEAGAGIPIRPEHAGELMQAVVRLKQQPDLHAHMAQNGYEHVQSYYDRSKLARRYAALLEQVSGRRASLSPSNVQSVAIE